MDILIAKVSAPKSDLDPPEIFLTTTHGLTPLSARLLVKARQHKVMLLGSCYGHKYFLGRKHGPLSLTGNYKLMQITYWEELTNIFLQTCQNRVSMFK